MLWMYAECARAAQDPPEYRDPVFSIFDFLFTVEIDAMEARPLFDQADRLFACRFATGGRTMPVIDPSFVRRPDEAQRLPLVASGRGWALAHGDAFRHALAERRFEPRLAIVRALRRRPFALDVYLWDAGYGDCAPSRRSRLARYHALAERPLRAPGVDDVLTFERELAPGAGQPPAPRARGGSRRRGGSSSADTHARGRAVRHCAHDGPTGARAPEGGEGRNLRGTPAGGRLASPLQALPACSPSTCPPTSRSASPGSPGAPVEHAVPDSVEGGTGTGQASPSSG